MESFINSLLPLEGGCCDEANQQVRNSGGHKIIPTHHSEGSHHSRTYRHRSCRQPLKICIIYF